MEVSVPVSFRGKMIEEDGYRIDLLANDTVILEIKLLFYRLFLTNKEPFLCASVRNFMNPL
jgi:hypothetical protein